MVSAKFFKATALFLLAAAAGVVEAAPVEAAPATSCPRGYDYMPGTTRDYANYHLVRSGETCDVVAAACSMTTGELLSINRGVHANCDNMWAGYCVAVRGDC